MALASNGRRKSPVSARPPKLLSSPASESTPRIVMNSGFLFRLDSCPCLSPKAMLDIAGEHTRTVIQASAVEQNQVGTGQLDPRGHTAVKKPAGLLENAIPVEHLRAVEKEFRFDFRVLHKR